MGEGGKPWAGRKMREKGFVILLKSRRVILWDSAKLVWNPAGILDKKSPDCYAQIKQQIRRAR